ncbi:hypothetical protein QVD17_28704 [Tagetes erecta]|uniref:NEDD8-activating enzyme E1 regulatory subunit n=1 Tax=Tagetes erecta TaxID=13708 RepID=A0AAD8KH69_TARER|nr:hypothetical protein QVD17_28704 [Tagetes erecta]
MAEAKTKYDRQLRIWGEQGQSALEKASICLLNCGPTGSETLKNLVLAGIGSITVVDVSKVVNQDLGNNFMVHHSSLGHPKAKCVCAFLQELNDAVKAKFIEEHPLTLIETNPSFFSQFTLVIATQLVEDSMVKLDRICRDANVMLVFARSYGLTGFVRISVKELNDAVKAKFIEEHALTLIETNPSFFSQFTLVIATQLVEDSMVKLDRICRDANVMLVFARSYGLTGFVRISVKEHAVIESKPDHFLDDLRLNNPWPELKKLITEEWAKSHDGNLPSTREEKKEFKELIREKMVEADEDNYREAVEASFKVFASQGISSDLKRILDDTCAEVESGASDIWVMVAALKEFIANEGGGEASLEGSIPDMTSSTEYKLIEEEFNPPVLPELQKYLTDEEYSVAVGFYILLRAVDRFSANYNTFPGQFDGAMDEDISRLKTTAVGLLSDLGCNGSTLTEDLINEMCRYGAAELHAVAAYIGGVASQEVIKITSAR